MKLFNVSIEGIAPLLQHRFPVEDFGENKTKGIKRNHSEKEDAEKSLYKTEDGSIFQPAIHLYGCLVKSAVDFKLGGRKTFKDAFKSGIRILPEQIPHKHQKWTIDLQPVVVQRARILRARPRFEKWALDFQVEVINESITGPVLNEVLVKAGQTIGIGDYRPLFGRFIVTKFSEA